jgi:hypothetical protein
MSINKLCFILHIGVIYFSINVFSLQKNIYLRSESYYNNTINEYCPHELDDNFAGKNGLYFNTSDIEIKTSLIRKYFNHCGAWCLFDYKDPRKGWYWDSELKIWKYHIDIYNICPFDEFYDSLNKFLNKKLNI